jgi:orotate phosphoribosyltransferase
MEKYKEEFIEFLLKQNVLKFGDFTLKSKRSSPYFINVGDLKDSEGIARLGEAFASTISSLNEDVDILFGPAYKGIPLAVATSIALGSKGKNTGFAFDRKEIKEYGEAAGADLSKKVIIGAEIKDGSSIVIVEDVFTTGETKYDALELLNKIARDLRFPALLIAVDRQEVGIDGKSAIQEFTEKTGIPVKSIISASDIVEYLEKEEGKFSQEIKKMQNYLRVYGTDEVKKNIKSLQQEIILRQKSVIPACDVSALEDFEDLVQQTAEVEGIGGYKVGFELALAYNLQKVVETVRKHTNKPVIYDHQKAATDIPDTGKNFARVCKQAKVDAIILFPQAGPETERAWIYHALNAGLNLIVGGRMTHPGYSVSEGGFLTDEGALEMYKIGAKAGINNFVVPGNKPEVIEQIKSLVESEGVSPTFYAPGFIAQGGKIGDATKIAGDNWHAIVGRGIYKAEDRKMAAVEHTSQLG